MKMLYYPYLGRDILSGFDQYKYSCLDTSPLSNYVMHPFWNQVVKICPLWIAPNLLTFVGFLCCIAHNLLTWIYDYTYDASTLDSPNPIPSGVWFAVSLLLFLSHTLDGIDGKQARRTGTSSPLGELFDHGCDSWSTVFITGTFYSVFGRNADGYSISEFRMYCILWTIFFSFHTSHWEKYNTGVMYLPWSYDIAMVGGTVLYALTGMLGYETWKVLLPGGRSPGVIVESVLYFFCYGFALAVTLKNIYVSYRDGTGKMRPFLDAMVPMVSYFLALILCMVWVLASPNGILESSVRIFFLMSGTLYANMSCRLIVTQMSNTKAQAFNLLLIPLGLAVLICTALPVSLGTEQAVLYLLTALVTVVHVHYGTCVVLQMCEHFRIECFKIKGSSSSSSQDPRLLYTQVPQIIDEADLLDDSDDEIM